MKPRSRFLLFIAICFGIAAMIIGIMGIWANSHLSYSYKLGDTSAVFIAAGVFLAVGVAMANS